MANTSHDSHHHDVVVDHSHHGHVSTFQIFLRVYVTLCVLTIVTVAASQVDFGGANMLIAVLIASIKASLVVTFFMHLKWDTAMNNIAFLGSLLFLSLLFLFTLADFATRGMADPTQMSPIR
ncbi:MAG: cytochrome C oxidase subunit IV family protein [Planctomycetes bacterium]|nr:cytochrome C oxidase subunit IV family protein [Planctomycetota bacterium]